MEYATNLVADPTRLPASPVMFLFSGAEEPLCQVSIFCETKSYI